MKKTLFLLLQVCALSLMAQKAEDIALFKETLQKYDKAKSISYKVTHKQKTLTDYTGDSIQILSGNIKMLKGNNMEKFNGKVLLENYMDLQGKEDNAIIYFDGNVYNFIEHNDKTYQTAEPKPNPYTPEYSNIFTSTFNTNFLTIKKLIETFNDKSIKVSYSDTANYLKVTFNYEDEPPFHKIETAYYVNRKTKNIEKKFSQVYWNEMVQLDYWDINNIVLDKVKEKDFIKATSKYLATYTNKTSSPTYTAEDFKLMDNGSLASEIEGFYYPKYEQKEVLKIDKVTILDFWYCNCGPCLLSIPYLNNWQEKYKDKLHIVGVNSMDAAESKKKQVAKTIEVHKINYDIFMTHSIPKDYNIKSYPTMYILDKEGKVIYTCIGFSKEKFENIDKFLEELFNKA